MTRVKFSDFMAVVQKTLALASANSVLGLVWVRPNGYIWGTVKAGPRDDPYARVPDDATVFELEPYHLPQGSVASKADPSPFEAFAKAEPDEPYFALLARDPEAPRLVREWANLSDDQPIEQRDEAERVAEAMERWRLAKLQTSEEK